MAVRVQVTLYPEKIKALEAAKNMAGEQAAASVHAHLLQDQLVPRDTGALEASGRTVTDRPGNYKITFGSSAVPYAARLYWNPGFRFRRDKNQNARGLWLQPFISGDRKDVFKDSFIRHLKKNGRGLIK